MLAVQDRTVAVWSMNGSQVGAAGQLCVQQSVLESVRSSSGLHDCHRHPPIIHPSSAAGRARSRNAEQWFAQDCMAVTWQIPHLKSPVCPCGQRSKVRLALSDSLQDCLVQNCRALSAQHAPAGGDLGLAGRLSISFCFSVLFWTC